MTHEFTATDIFDIAIQIEQNGARFYRRAANLVDQENHKQFLTALADMEDDHEKTFAAMKDQLTDAASAAPVFDPEDENTRYLKALADTRVFFEKDQPDPSMKGILTAAIAAEKDSIAFYLGMKELVPEKLGKTKVGEIIKEEMRHIQILAGQLTRLA
ncbi:MAG TPA: ferritin family protein [Desulfotignum sp.]|jgi:rubrerythrin|nr:ferritin family protein [Desulfotignum sp.]